MAKNDGPLTIAALRIENFLGIRLLELDAIGTLTTATGANGVGKSSVLKAVAAALGGSKKAAGLLHQGAEEGEVYLRLSDGTEISRRITAEGAREATVKDGRLHQPIKGPEAYLKGLFDSLALDPTAFVLAKPADHARMLLEAFPVSTTPEEVESVTGMRPDSNWGSLLGLPQVAGIEKEWREARTAVNGARTKATKTLEGMGQALDKEAEPEKDWRGELERLRRLKSETEEGLRAEIGRSDQLANQERERLRGCLETELEAVRAKYSPLMIEVGAQDAARQRAAGEESRPTLEGLAAKIATAEDRDRRAAGAAKARELLEGMRKDLEGYEAEWRSLDKAVKGLESLKTELCGRLPLEGVEVDENGLRVKDGHGAMIQFETLNTAEQIKFAVRLAVKKSGALKAVLADGLERLDATTRAAFLEEAKATGAQFLVAFATDTDALFVETEGKP